MEERFRQRRAPRNRGPVFDGQGSGVVVREDGYILTNGHVVEGAEKIKVRFSDGKEYPAEVRGVDPQSDVAVIRVEAQGLPAAEFADSAKVRVGEFAIAIGAPFELDYSVTFGHVSAKGRSAVIPGEQAMDQDFIQTDASINPGNSGGPLVNIDGEVMGINTLIRGLRTGIGFAIPSNLVLEVASQLIEQGKFTRAWLGLQISALKDDEDVRGLVGDLQDGVVVRGIVQDGPAAKSELRLGDIITTVDGQPVATAQELRSKVRSRKLGSKVVLDVVRGGEALKVEVSPEAWPEELAGGSRRGTSPTAPQTTDLGITVKPLTRELAKEMEIEFNEGVVVTAVDPDSAAAAKGIQAGDIITEVNQRETTTIRQFREAVRAADAAKGVVVNLVRSGVSRFVVLKNTGE
jgi:serine protease Do